MVLTADSAGTGQPIFGDFRIFSSNIIRNMCSKCNVGSRTPETSAVTQSLLIAHTVIVMYMVETVRCNVPSCSRFSISIGKFERIVDELKEPYHQSFSDTTSLSI